jgi:DNA-binding LacI/PurR family transcriptional regulator
LKPRNPQDDLASDGAGHRPLRRRATISDVARKAGVSPSTVSNVLNGRFDTMLTQTRESVAAAIAELDYRPSPLARGLRTRRTHVVGLIVPSASNGVYPAFIKGAQDAALRHGFDTFVCSTDRDPTKNRVHITSLLDRRVDGIVFMHTLSPDDPLLDSCRASDTPIVVFTPNAEPPPVPAICLDNDHAMATVLGYLARLGHRRIAYADHSLTSSNRVVRGQAHRQVLARLNLEEWPDAVATAQVALGSDEGYEIESGRSIVRRLLALADPPTAIIGGNDLIAAGVLNGAKELGYRVPQDLSVVGFDDLTVGRVTDPPLTTMQLPTAAIGEAAFGLIMDQLQGAMATPAFHAYRFDLLVRRSTDRAPGDHPDSVHAEVGHTQRATGSLESHG